MVRSVVKIDGYCPWFEGAFLKPHVCWTMFILSLILHWYEIKCWGAGIRPLCEKVTSWDHSGKQTESDESEGKPGSHTKLEIAFHDLKHGAYKNKRQQICSQHFTCRLSNFLASKLLDLRLCCSVSGSAALFQPWNRSEIQNSFPQKNLLMRRPGCFKIWDTGWNRWSLLWRKPWRPEDGRQTTPSLGGWAEVQAKKTRTHPNSIFCFFSVFRKYIYG